MRIGRLIAVLFSLTLLGATHPVAAASEETDDLVRLAVVVSSNAGVATDQDLRYADDEGQLVAELLVEVGRVDPAHLERVPAATPDELAAALGRTVVAAAALREEGARVAVLLYYTGHAGTDGLHLSGEVMSLDALKASVRVVPAELRVFVIDACQSGAIMRSKGAKLLELRSEPVVFEPPPDEAWLTSAGPEEQAYEVDRRRGALFTHFFVSGVRGAADANGDRMVTLSEVYAFVAHQTTATAAASGRVQQPRWAGELGDLVLGDLRSPDSGLEVTGPVATPLLVIRRDREQVVGEIPVGVGGFMALPPGPYQLVSVEGAGRPRMAELELRHGHVAKFEPGERLARVPGVRSKGGLLLARPWSLGGGYRLGVGETPARTDSHGGYLRVGRVLGHGHGLALVATVGGSPFHNEFVDGQNLRLAAEAEWSYDWSWRTVRFGPSLRVGGGWLRQSSARRPSPQWNDWYGGDDGEQIGDFALWTARLQLGLTVPLGRRLDAHLAAGGGLQVVAAETPAVFPTAAIEAGLHVRF